MSTRVYVPGSTRGLRELLVAGGLGPVPLLAHAVTDELRAALPDLTEEEWEYAALTAAAQDSLGLLDEDDVPRRVVVVAEASSVARPAAGEAGLVEVVEVIPRGRVLAVHADSDDAGGVVAEARKVWAAAQEGDPAAEEVLDRCLDHELGWYATQEVAILLGDG